MQKNEKGVVFLNADWYKNCKGCKKYWCSSTSCDSPDCGCPQYYTAQMFYKGEIAFTLCGTCKKTAGEWLARNDPRPSKVLRIRIEGENET